MKVLLALGAAYLIGAIPVGFLIARAFGGTDIRRHGSGNIGATNVLRTLGRLPGILTLLGDVAKGYAVIAFGRAMLGGESTAVAACGVLAVVGNCWPVYLGFRGGKGVATALGAFLGLMPWATLPAALVWIVSVAISRYVSLGSILAALSVPVGALLWRYPGAFVATAAVVAVIIVARHHENIARLLSGTERRVGHRASA